MKGYASMKKGQGPRAQTDGAFTLAPKALNSIATGSHLGSTAQAQIPGRTSSPPPVTASQQRKRPRLVAYVEVPSFPPGYSSRDYSPGIPPPSPSSENENEDDALRGPAGLALMMSRAAIHNASLHEGAADGRSPSASISTIPQIVREPSPSLGTASQQRKRPRLVAYVEVPSFPPGYSSRDCSPGIPPPSGDERTPSASPPPLIRRSRAPSPPSFPLAGSTPDVGLPLVDAIVPPADEVTAAAPADAALPRRLSRLEVTLEMLERDRLERRRRRLAWLAPLPTDDAPEHRYVPRSRTEVFCGFD
jgi:hypothetical protein